jgi:hypothetical protein
LTWAPQSFVLAIVVFFCLPSRPDTSKFLNENERTLALTRLNADNLDEAHGGIDKRAVKRAFTDWKTWVVSIMCASTSIRARWFLKACADEIETQTLA